MFFFINDNTNIVEEIHKNIRQKREAKNYTQEYMAEELSITQSYYCKLENGSQDIRYSMLKKIAQILEIDLKDLVE